MNSRPSPHSPGTMDVKRGDRKKIKTEAWGGLEERKEMTPRTGAGPWEARAWCGNGRGKTHVWSTRQSKSCHDKTGSGTMKRAEQPVPAFPVCYVVQKRRSGSVKSGSQAVRKGRTHPPRQEPQSAGPGEQCRNSACVQASLRAH